MPSLSHLRRVLGWMPGILAASKRCKGWSLSCPYINTPYHVLSSLNYGVTPGSCSGCGAGSLIPGQHRLLLRQGDAPLNDLEVTGVDLASDEVAPGLDARDTVVPTPVKQSITVSPGKSK